MANNLNGRFLVPPELRFEALWSNVEELIPAAATPYHRCSRLPSDPVMN